MPNRCYAVAGDSGGQIDALRPPQPYNLKSFCRHLDDAKVCWRWYSHDYVPMLWLIDPEYGALRRDDPGLLRPQGRLRAPQLPRTRRRRRPSRRLLDRPELHRPDLRPGRLERRPPTLRPARRPEAGARAVRRGRAEPGLGEDAARDHLRRTRRLLRPRPAARQPRTTRRTLRQLGPRVPAIVDLTLGRQSARSRRRSSITPRSSRRSSPASAANPTAPSPTWAPASAPPNTSAALLARSRGRTATPRAQYQALIDQTQNWGEKLATHADPADRRRDPRRAAAPDRLPGRVPRSPPHHPRRAGLLEKTLSAEPERSEQEDNQ